jgi:hypothetical protein
MGWLPCKCVPVDECRLITTPGCAEDASIYLISVSGLANDDCSSCNTWNGAFSLKYASAGVWESPASSSTSCGHTDGDPLWRLSYASSTYTLEAIGIGYRWRLSGASWVCNGTNVLSRTNPYFVPDPCSSVPASITVVPCTVECALCTGTMPDTISVTLSGLVDGGTLLTCYCSTLNGTHVLASIGPCHWRTSGTFGCHHGYDKTYYIDVSLMKLDGTVKFKVFGSVSGWGDYVFTYTYETGSPDLIDCEATYYPTLDEWEWGNYAWLWTCGSVPVVRIN